MDFKGIFLFFVFISFYFISGCINFNQQILKECQAYNQTQKDECIKYYAIVNENPDLCYNLNNYNVRKECIQTSIDPKEVSKYKKDLDFKRYLQMVASQTQVPQQKTEENTFEAQIKQCMKNTLRSYDDCLSEFAKTNKDITLCDKIKTDEYRRSCIANIVLEKKDMSICSKLNFEPDKQLCLFYSG